MDKKILNSIKNHLNTNKKLDQAEIFKIAKKLNTSVQKVEEIAENHGICVDCDLTCQSEFKDQKDKVFVLKTKTWIENSNGDLLLGKGKIELLEFIHQTGSILHAAKKMGINYKKAWTHLKILQNNTQEDLVITRQGRSKESGTKLTQKALELMQKYSILQKDIEKFANKRFEELFSQNEKAK